MDEHIFKIFWEKGKKIKHKEGLNFTRENQKSTLLTITQSRSTFKSVAIHLLLMLSQKRTKREKRNKEGSVIGPWNLGHILALGLKYKHMARVKD